MTNREIHPILGDESPLYVISPKGKIAKSDFWEVSTLWNILKKN
jgi:hypothetical protein